MHIDILTLFPEMFTSYLNESILKRAQEAGHLRLRWHNIRDYAIGRHRVTDEPPYGGGGGMILKPEPIFRAVENVLQESRLVLSEAEGGAGERRVTLTFNERGHFECRWVYLQPNPNSPCLFMQGLDELIYCPVAHGEGRLVVADEDTAVSSLSLLPSS